MKKTFLCSILLFSSCLAADPTPPEEPIQDEYAFYLIQENIKSLDCCDTCDYATNELMNLLQEGYLNARTNVEKVRKALHEREQKL
ncbi:MAG: hypothetical protein K2X08_01800 [Chlamydiales bacterium]|nr:hypothetical protein [Chlamydiales bacterium]